jgi:hypothetical protein
MTWTRHLPDKNLNIFYDFKQTLSQTVSLNTDGMVSVLNSPHDSWKPIRNPAVFSSYDEHVYTSSPEKIETCIRTETFVVQKNRHVYTTQKYLNSGSGRPISSSIPQTKLSLESRTQRLRVQISLQVYKDNIDFLYCPALVEALHCTDDLSKISYQMPRTVLLNIS